MEDLIYEKKGWQCLFAVMMVVSVLVFPAQAVSMESPVQPDTISENVAEIIATNFISDSQSFPEISWTADTEINNTVTMYGTDGEVSAYSFELDTSGQRNGYVVITAYPDIANKVLEFSDKLEPVYDLLDLGEEDTVVYTGLMNYYKDDGGSTLSSINNVRVVVSDVPTPLAEARSESNLPAVLAKSKYPIRDPYEWANTYYEGPFVYGGDSINEFESHCPFCTTADFMDEYTNNCGPTAITNLIGMIGSYKDYSRITSENYSDIFLAVADYGVKNKYFNEASGSRLGTLDSYIAGSFGLYGVNATVTSKDATFNNVKSELTNHRPLYLSLNQHSYYGDHGVVGYAYTRLQSETTGYYLSFIKIADGEALYGRYLDIACIDEHNEAILRAININNL